MRVMKLSERLQTYKQDKGFTQLVEKDDVRGTANRYSRHVSTSSFFTTGPVHALFRNRYGAGFTLIELLVVVSIISLLSSVILASVNEARESARDSQRVQELRQIQNALELYASANDEYPSGSSNSDNDCNGAEWSFLSVLKDQNYMSEMPHEPTWPSNTGTDYCYRYQVDPPPFFDSFCEGNEGADYLLYFTAETEQNLPEFGLGAMRYCVPPIK